MSEVDLDSRVLSEDTDSGDEKLVPVGEAIRYRKRAQGAEKEAADLAEEAKQLRELNEELTGDLEAMRTDHELMRALSSAGAVDLEGAVLIAKSRLENGEEKEIASVVELLRSEKSYLFGGQAQRKAASKTAGVKEKESGGQRVLEGRAKKAAASGSRADVHEYMQIRRPFV